MTGVGSAAPNHALTAADALEMARRLCCQTPKHARLVDALYRRSGVAQRQTCVPHEQAYDWEGAPGGPTLGERMAMYEQHAAPLALRAAQAALRDADLDAKRVTHLVTVSCTGFEAPGVDLALISSLGLSAETQRVHVGFMGCHGAVNALRVVHGIAAADPGAVILLVATELCSLHFCYGWDPERLVGNALFGDASAAVVGVAERHASGRWRLAATGSCLLPDSAGLMSWRVRDHGFEMTLSSRLPEVVAEELPRWLPDWLQRHGRDVESVGSWAVHPGGPKVLDAVEHALGLTAEQTAVSREVLHEHGNVSSATVLLLLERLRSAAARGPTLMLAFGPGLFAELALWE